MYVADIPSELDANYLHVEKTLIDVTFQEAARADEKMLLVKFAFDQLAAELMALPNDTRLQRTAALAQLLNEVVLLFRLSLSTSVLREQYRLSENVTAQNAAEACFSAKCDAAHDLYAKIRQL